METEKNKAEEPKSKGILFWLLLFAGITTLLIVALNYLLNLMIK